MESVQNTMVLVDSFGSAVDPTVARYTTARVELELHHVRTFAVGRPLEDGEMADLGYTLVASSARGRRGEMAVLYRSERRKALALFEQTDLGSYQVQVAAGDKTSAEREENTLESLYPVAVGHDDEGSLAMTFCWYGGKGLRTRVRDVSGTAWGEIDRNYPGRTKDALGALMARTGLTGSGGRIILFHGAPGTGKTTAARALAHSCRSWCTSSCVVDPEALFSSPDYLFELLVDEPEPSHLEPDHLGSRPGARLVIIEDVDELIQADAKQRSGQALGRLLNITDGILGQGLDIVFLLTTNEPLISIHPAVSRAGRCLANIEFCRFSRVEAGEWLGGGAVVGDEPTLAELYARTAGEVIVGTRPTPRSGGTYL